MATACRTRPLSSPTACYTCNEEGHIARDCPDKAKKGNKRVSVVEQAGDHVRRSILKPSVEGSQHVAGTGELWTQKVVRFALTDRKPATRRGSKFHEQIARMTIYLNDIQYPRDAVVDTGASVSIVGLSAIKDIPHQMLSPGK